MTALRMAAVPTAVELCDACWEGRVGAATLCLDRGVDVDGVDEEGLAPLFIAIQMSNLELVRLLLSRGATVTG